MFYENGLVKIEKIKYERNNELLQNVLPKLYELNSLYNVFEPIIGGNSSRATVNGKQHFLGNWPEFRDYIDFIKPHMRSYVSALNEIEDNYWVCDMWSNKYPPGTTLYRHKHPFFAPERPFPISNPDSVTVVLYLKKPKDSGNLVLELPEEDSIREYILDTEEGDIVIFQGAIYHSVTKNNSDGDKFTIITEMNLRKFVEPTELRITLEDY